MKQPSLKATLGLIIVLFAVLATTIPPTPRCFQLLPALLARSSKSRDNRTYLLTVKAESGAMVPSSLTKPRKLDNSRRTRDLSRTRRPSLQPTSRQVIASMRGAPALIARGMHVPVN
jgi:hypothetical protein